MSLVSQRVTTRPNSQVSRAAMQKGCIDHIPIEVSVRYVCRVRRTNVSFHFIYLFPALKKIPSIKNNAQVQKQLAMSAHLLTHRSSLLTLAPRWLYGVSLHLAFQVRLRLWSVVHIMLRLNALESDSICERHQCPCGTMHGWPTVMHTLYLMQVDKCLPNRGLSNLMNWRVVERAHVSTIKKTACLVRSDGRRPRFHLI